MEYLTFLVAGLGQGAVYALSGIGIVVLYQASGVVNLAFGAQAALGAMCAWIMLQSYGTPWLVWPVSVLVAVTTSVAYGVVFNPRLSHRDRSVQAMGSLAFALVLLGLMSFWWGEVPRRFELPTDRHAIAIAEVRMTYTRLFALLAALLSAVGISLLIAKTSVGLWMRALADSRRVSLLSGVPVFRADVTAWAVSGVLAGVSGVFLASMVRLQPSFLTFLVIPAIATALLGGFRSLWWTLTAGLMLGVAESALAMLPEISPFRTGLPYVVALVAVALWSFFGNARTAE